MKDKMLVLVGDDGKEKLRCRIGDVTAIQRRSTNLGEAGYLRYSTLHTRGGNIDVYAPGYDELLLKLGWVDKKEIQGSNT